MKLIKEGCLDHGGDKSCSGCPFIDFCSYDDNIQLPTDWKINN
jgi:hypothetical protein